MMACGCVGTSGEDVRQHDDAALLDREKVAQVADNVACG